MTIKISRASAREIFVYRRRFLKWRVPEKRKSEHCVEKTYRKCYNASEKACPRGLFLALLSANNDLREQNCRGTTVADKTKILSRFDCCYRIIKNIEAFSNLFPLSTVCKSSTQKNKTKGDDKMVYMHENDETLVMLTLAGEQRAYEVLVARYQKSVIAAAKSITRNDFMAEDSAQDAFVTAWMKLNTLQEPKKFVYWVCRIAKNCALNTLERFRTFIPLCDVENTDVATDPESNPEEAFIVSESEEELNKQMAGLPEKVRRIIYLHYYDGLSIAEIADKMRIPDGTVKWQLYDGRKRIRKGLCAMNEKENDNLTEKVMKKVEELKLWQLRNSKAGFEDVYADVLSEVEKLPESGKRSHALADVLMCGWWWLPGEKNDALFARIKEAALAGKNEEVMRFIVAREDGLVQSGKAREDFMQNKQIPYLEKAGFKETLAYEWLRLGDYRIRQGSFDNVKTAFEKAKEVVPEGSIYYSLANESIALTDVVEGFKEKDWKRYTVETHAFDIRRIGGELCFWETQYGISDGWITSIINGANDIFRNASYCDGKFLPSGLSVGETITGTDGTTVTEKPSKRLAEPLKAAVS